MKRIKIYFFDLMIILAELVIGFLLIISPEGFTRGIIITFAAALSLVGIINIITYFKTDAETAALQQKLAKGLVGLVVGLFLGIRSQWFVDYFPMLTTLYGIALLTVAIFKLQRIVDFLRLNKQGWHLAGIGTLLLAIMGILLLVNPFNKASFVWALIVVALFADAALTFATIIVTARSKDGEKQEIDVV